MIFEKQLPSLRSRKEHFLFGLIWMWYIVATCVFFYSFHFGVLKNNLGVRKKNIFKVNIICVNQNAFI